MLGHLLWPAEHPRVHRSSNTDELPFRAEDLDLRCVPFVLNGSRIRSELYRRVRKGVPSPGLAHLARELNPTNSFDEDVRAVHDER